MLTARKTLSVSASHHNRLFLSSPYLCVNRVFICDLLRVRFRVSEYCGLQVINYWPFQSVTYVMVISAQFGYGWRVSYFPCTHNMNVMFYSFGIRFSLKDITAFLLC